MTLILDAYTKNAGRKSLFSKIIDIDFYDGPTEALCQLAESSQWFIGSLVNFDIKKDIRVFTILEINDEWALELKEMLTSDSIIQPNRYENIKKRVGQLYSNYSGLVFLFKGHQLNEMGYEVVQISLEYLKYFKEMEDVLEQTEESKLQWMSFFG